MDGNRFDPKAEVRESLALKPPRLNEAQAIKLLHALGTDAGYHARFQASPAEALAELQLPVSFAQCCEGIVLPSPDVIRATEKILVSDLSAHSDLHVIGLCVR